MSEMGWPYRFREYAVRIRIRPEGRVVDVILHVWAQRIEDALKSARSSAAEMIGDDKELRWAPKEIEWHLYEETKSRYSGRCRE